MSARYMVRVPIYFDRLVQNANLAHVGAEKLDLGYLVHMEIRALFPGLAITPFRVEPAEGTRAVIPVLGYSESDAETLRSEAQLHAAPRAWQAVEWAGFGAKAMPTSFAVGAVLAFAVRACPIVRQKTPGGQTGREIDVFLARAAASESPEGVDRETVYLEWIARQLGGAGGASVVESRVSSWARERLGRRTHDVHRTVRTLERPSVDFQGLLRVENSALFGALVDRGLGRHRAFGFGMLMLRRPGRS